MINISPFRSLLASPDKIKQISAPPYDVVSRIEASEYAKNNPLNFLHVSRSEIDLSESTDPYSEIVYSTAKQNFEDLQKEAPLQIDEKNSFYIYSLVMNGQRQTGIVAAASVDNYDQDRIKKHELTRKEKEDDRTKHTTSLSAHTGPVFLTYRPVVRIDEIIQDQMKKHPIYDFKTDDEVTHQIWRLAGNLNERLIALFQEVPSLYVADGHHRAKSASRARDWCRSQNTQHTGEEPYNRFLSVIFPADQLNILAYNRVVSGLGRKGAKEFLNELAHDFDIQDTAEKIPNCKGNFHMYFRGKWHKLNQKSNGSAATIVDRS